MLIEVASDRFENFFKFKLVFLPGPAPFGLARRLCRVDLEIKAACREVEVVVADTPALLVR
jgi:hypothetical protein